MCHPKPGPRCAAHLTARLTKVNYDRDQAAAAGSITRVRELDATALALADELDETRTGQQRLAEQIQQQVSSKTRAILQARADAAAERHQQRLAALAATQPATVPEARTVSNIHGAVVGPLRDHELSHLGIYTATTEDGLTVAYNTQGPNVPCGGCHGERSKQATCSECSGRGAVDMVPYCDRNWDHINSGLFLGGHDTQPGGGSTVVTDEFDMVVSLYTRPDHGPDERVPHYTYEMADAPLEDRDYQAINYLADKVAEATQQNKSVLVRCQAGMNRSGLVAGLSLVKQGWTTDQVLDRMRNARSPYVLFNKSFVAHLRSQEAHVTVRRCDSCSGQREFFGSPCPTCNGRGNLPR